MSQEDKSVTPKKKNELLIRNADLIKVSDFANTKEKEVEKLTTDFTKKGSLGLFWDSKVPEKDKAFYYFFTLTSSNRGDVLTEIKKYQEFYKELSTAVQKVEDPEERDDDEKVDPHIIIRELNEKLSKIAEAAQLGKDVTPSSAIYDLHKSFIEKHEKLKDMIKGLECVALNEGYKTAKIGWIKSTQRINKLESKLKVFEEWSEKYGNVVLEGQEALKEQKNFAEEKKKILDMQEKLLQKYEEMEQKQENLRQNNQKIKEEQKLLLQKNMELEEEQKKLRLKNQKMEEEHKLLLQENHSIKAQLQTMEKLENTDKNGPIETIEHQRNSSVKSLVESMEKQEKYDKK